MRQYLKKNILLLFFIIYYISLEKIYIFPIAWSCKRKNSSFRSETISDLLACCAHVTASIIRTFPPCFPDQMPFLLLFLQPILRIFFSTFSSFSVRPVPLIS
ncbi:hypothetical protein ACJW31_05G202800 [Castanea mollissima]